MRGGISSFARPAFGSGTKKSILLSALAWGIRLIQPGNFAAGCPVNDINAREEIVIEMSERPIRANLALAVIVIGVLITAVDSTIVVLALPTMMRHLHAALSTVVWIVMAYLLVITLLATQVGRLGDMFGRVRMYEVGFIIFIIGSAWCGLSTDWIILVLARVVQGIGGALVSANSGAVIADVFPPQTRGRAYGYNSIGWNLGAILGILLGGFITTFFSWRWIFFINVPIGAVALGLALYSLHEISEPKRQLFDVPGLVSLGVGLAAILLGMTRLSSEGWTTPNDVMLAGGFVVLALFVLIESRQSHPLLHLDLFRVRVVGFSLLAALLQGLGGFAVLFLIMMFLQGARGLTPLNASLLLVPGYLIGGVTGPIAGRLSDRVGSVLPATIGLGLQGVAVLVYAQLGAHSSLGWIVVASVINGIGSGGFFPSNNAAVMKGAPQGQYGVASGMLRTFANIGMVMSFAAAILMASARIPRGLAFAIFVGTTHLTPASQAAFITGLHLALYLSIGMLVLAALASSIRGSVSSAEVASRASR